MAENFGSLLPQRGNGQRVLEAKILLTMAGSSGNLLTNAVVAGDFAGAAPTHTPTIAAQVAMDTSDGTKNYWYGSAWH